MLLLLGKTINTMYIENRYFKKVPDLDLLVYLPISLLCLFLLGLFVVLGAELKAT